MVGFFMNWLIRYTLKARSTRLFLYSWFHYFRLPQLFDYCYLHSRWLQSLLRFQLNRFERTLRPCQKMMELGARQGITVRPHSVALRSSGYLEIHELLLPHPPAASIISRPVVCVVCGPATDGEIFLHRQSQLLAALLRLGCAVWIVNGRDSKYFSDHAPTPPPFYTSSSASQHVAKVSYAEENDVRADFRSEHVQDLHHALAYINQHYLEGSEENRELIPYLTSPYVLMGYLTGADLIRLFLLSHQSDELNHRHRLSGTVLLCPLYSITQTPQTSQTILSSSSPKLAVHSQFFQSGWRGYWEYMMVYLSYERGWVDLLFVFGQDIFQPLYYHLLVSSYYYYFLNGAVRSEGAGPVQIVRNMKSEKSSGDASFSELFPHKQFLHSLLYRRSYERLLKKYWKNRCEGNRLTFPSNHSDVICYAKTVGSEREEEKEVEEHFSAESETEIGRRNSLLVLLDEEVQSKVETFIRSLPSH